MKKFLTKNQQLLLKLFYTNPKKSFYLQEIGKILGMKPGVFHRTINGLVEEGLLKSTYQANARYFQANTKHPLYPEFRKIITKTIGIEETLKVLTHRIKDIKIAVLYGSFAKGKDRKESDIDLLIVGKADVEDKILKEILLLEKKVQREINYKIYSDNEFQSKCLKKDPFLQEILNDKKIVLKGKIDAI